SCSLICHGLCSRLVRPWGMLNQRQFRYFHRASGEMYVISRALAKFVSIN
ncbi:hypothetical protein S83_035545, partial [Arachis hypogaea]